MKTTGKFGSILNNESFIDRFKTQLTENFGRSQIHPIKNQSQMNISQLQQPVRRKGTIGEGTQHVINGNIKSEETIYRCTICDRLRSICPYKSFKTYQYCQKCVVQEKEKKHQRPRIFSNATPYLSKQLNSTFAETRVHQNTRGVNNLRIDGGIRNMAEVDRVRFVQSNNVYPLGNAGYRTTNNASQYKYESTANYASKQATKNVQRPRSTTQHVIISQPTASYHHVINQQKIIPTPPNIQEIIFYPVIHNKIVYKSAQKQSQNVEELGETIQIKRSRYQSNHSGKKSKRQMDKAVSDFLHTTKPNEILTPFQFKKLADSIYRETNPNIIQE